jgi:hypothetical protein
MVHFLRLGGLPPGFILCCDHAGTSGIEVEAARYFRIAALEKQGFPTGD